ncbi:MAG: hypothetical protein SGBAC_001986 [Bacillariaceae sp.]
MAATAASATAQAPPIAHAIGGSLGSAIALLIFYPLERARIELQSGASQPTKNPALDSVEADVDGLSTNDRGEISPSPHTKGISSAAFADSSWESLSQDEEINESSNEPTETQLNNKIIHSSSPINSTTESFLATTSVTKKRKETLLECLVRLHQRNDLYTGVSPVVSTILTSQFIFFYMHAVVKKLLNQSSKGGSRRFNGAAFSLLSSCIAGLGNVLLTNPLWVVNMAIITGDTKTRNLWRELYVMVQKKGLRHMWRGTSASVLLVSNPVIQFFCYEQIKVARLSSPTQSVLSPMEAFFIGALAKGVATVTT